MRVLRPIIWLVSLLLVISLTRSVVALLQKRDIVKDQQAQLARLEQENQELEQALAQAETPEFIEKMAREKLGLVKEGETVVILPRSEAQVEADGKNVEPWRQWWGLFF